MSQYSRVGQARDQHRRTAFGASRVPQQSPTESDGPSYDELYEEARKRGLKGRSKMSKTELERALAL